ncbi:MAG: tRNA pseudouridine(38-40) synthase TruA [Treponema sp.]|jgi:tRNA pseudouridine38-40 synthase|nr:tRNA pseudouridine(38-40) synthase TruA [Treponema sp.]
MRNISLVIAYDGTDFAGWQRQRGPRTVQGEIERALAKIHKTPAALTGSGRTDAGVHARGQRAHFFTPVVSMEAERFAPALNGLLPPDIRILGAKEEAPGFHARFDARSRTYRYFFIPRRSFLPSESRYALPLRGRPDLSLLNAYCRFFRGEYDCSVFAAAGDKSRSPFRYIYGASFFVEGEKLVFEIRANAFLWKMVRSLAGTLLHYADRGLDPAAFGVLAASGRRDLAGPTLPPAGLFLWDIGY